MRIIFILVLVLQILSSCSDEYVPTYEMTEINPALILGEYFGELMLTINDSSYHNFSARVFISTLDSITFSISFDTILLGDPVWHFIENGMVDMEDEIANPTGTYMVPNLKFQLDQIEFYEKDQSAILRFLTGQEFFGDPPVTSGMANYLGPTIRVWTINKPYVVVLDVGLTSESKETNSVSKISFHADRYFE